jgi:hypothetical protein
MPTYSDVDPATLHLPSSRHTGADRNKPTRQLSRYGLSVQGMPLVQVSRDGGGRLQILDGVTRATRVAKWLPGQRLRVEVTEEYAHHDYSRYPTVGDRLP